VCSVAPAIVAQPPPVPKPIGAVAVAGDDSDLLERHADLIAAVDERHLVPGRGICDVNPRLMPSSSTASHLLGPIIASAAFGPGAASMKVATPSPRWRPSAALRPDGAERRQVDDLGHALE
jgi:hypothetical protein